MSKMFLLAFVFSMNFSWAQGLVGNGGNMQNFYNYIGRYKIHRSSLPNEFSVVDYPQEFAARFRCERFFKAAFTAWTRVTEDNVLGLSIDSLVKIKNPKIPEHVKDFWNAFKGLDLAKLCQTSKYYAEAKIFDLTTKRYLAVNSFTRMKIYYDPLLEASTLNITCLFMRPLYINNNKTCSEKFLEAIGLHEVFGIIFPRFENTNSYYYSSAYFYSYWSD